VIIDPIKNCKYAIAKTVSKSVEIEVENTVLIAHMVKEADRITATSMPVQNAANAVKFILFILFPSMCLVYHKSIVSQGNFVMSQKNNKLSS
jgi:hypothetical protein